MKCVNCNAEVPASTKFCPNCGKPVIEENATITMNDMNIGWLEETVKLLGYNVDHEKCEGPEFRASKEKRVTIYVALKKELKIITFNSYIPLKTLGRSEKETVLEILNMANGKGTYCTFYANLNNNFLNIYSYLPITDCIAKQDVLHIFERFSEEMGVTAVATKLIDYVL
jgi:hypothetical protein